MTQISHSKCYFGKFVTSFLLSISVGIEINIITIWTLWYANDMAVAEGTSGAKIGVSSFEKMKSHFELALT